jgi:arginase
VIGVVRAIAKRQRHGHALCQDVAVIALVSSPTNLGLRPPRPGSTPGTSKAPEALREAGLFRALMEDGAIDAGVVLSGRYVADDEVRPAGRVRNQEAIIDHARRLADRVSRILDAGYAPLIVGGDCSILVGVGLALSRRGRLGLIHVDGHTDFRHPGNSDDCASVAGEDLAASIGLHWPAIADIDGAGPYFDPRRAAHIGHRDDDEGAAEARRALGLVVSAAEAMAREPADVAAALRETAGPGYWLQVDVDVLDPSIMPAVDSPDPGGLDAAQLTELLVRLAPGAVGASITVFDPDLDPDGRYARSITEMVVAGLAHLGTAT